MDSSDPDIQFDEQGVCNHCHKYDAMLIHVFTKEEGRRKAQEIARAIKEEGSGKDYNCLIGVSGGVDSTFVAYKVRELGLRPLAVHLDNGWDSELAVNNIHKALKTLNIDLDTHVIDWEEFKDLQLAFLRASTPDAEIPSDHAIVSLMYQMADKTKTKYVITGRNVRTETHLPPAWSRGHSDWKYIQNVHKQFGTVELRTFPHRSRLEELRYKREQKWINLLNYVDYVKSDAIHVLERELGWKYYGGKHYESIYTRFFQGYILPVKFGYDKRRCHFSSLICSGEMKREEALKALETPTYPPEMQKEDREYVLKKFGLTEEDFNAIMKLPKKTIYNYPSYARDSQRPHYRLLRWAFRTFKRARTLMGQNAEPFET